MEKKNWEQTQGVTQIVSGKTKRQSFWYHGTPVLRVKKENSTVSRIATFHGVFVPGLLLVALLFLLDYLQQQINSGLPVSWCCCKLDWKSFGASALCYLSPVLLHFHIWLRLISWCSRIGGVGIDLEGLEDQPNHKFIWGWWSKGLENICNEWRMQLTWSYTLRMF